MRFVVLLVATGFLAAGILAGSVVGGARGQRAGDLARPQGSSQVPGATYTGTHAGGGAVKLTLAANGASVLSFTVEGLSGICPSGDWIVAVFDAPIRGGRFEYAPPPAPFGGFSSITGTFTTPTSVTGAFAFKDPAGQPVCNPSSLTWTATTSAAPPPTATAPSVPTTTQTSPVSPPSATTPFFHGGHDSARLVRAPTGVTVKMTFQACGSLQGLRLFVTQRLRAGGKVVAEQKFSRKLPAGVPAPPVGSQKCRDHAVSWPLAGKLFGSGWITITLRLVDGTGHESGAPQWALRAPKR